MQRVWIVLFIIFSFFCFEGKVMGEITKSTTTADLKATLLTDEKVFVLNASDHKLPEELSAIVNSYDSSKSYSKINIAYPLNSTLFPSDIRPPLFVWEEHEPLLHSWIIKFSFKQSLSNNIYILINSTQWTPDDKLWEIIKKRSLENEAAITIWGIKHNKIQSEGSFKFTTSKDPVNDSIIYRTLPLPLSFVGDHLFMLSMMLADITTSRKPKTLLTGMNSCFNCHSFSKNGLNLGFFNQVTMRHKNIDNILGLNDLPLTMKENGAFFQLYSISRLRDKKFKINAQNSFNIDRYIDVKTKKRVWAPYDYLKVGPPTALQFLRLSPDARDVAHVVAINATVPISRNKDYSFRFIYLNGLIGTYSKNKKEFRLLKGADNSDYIYTNPSWSPNKEYIIFSRAKKNETTDKLLKDAGEKILNFKDYGDSDLGIIEKKIFEKLPKYDLCKVPFNNGQGGKAEVVISSKLNGMNNYFPRYSPDGKWIVYTASKQGSIFIQPDSELYIVAASGGTPKRLKYNFKGTMNSWHSWSSNSKWLVFSSKVNSAYTEMFLTHIDEEGNDSPPVYLHSMAPPDRAVNLPEFVAIGYDDLDEFDVEEKAVRYNVETRNKCKTCHEARNFTGENREPREVKINKFMNYFQKVNDNQSYTDYIKQIISGDQP